MLSPAAQVLLIAQAAREEYVTYASMVSILPPIVRAAKLAILERIAIAAIQITFQYWFPSRVLLILWLFQTARSTRIVRLAAFAHPLTPEASAILAISGTVLRTA